MDLDNLSDMEPAKAAVTVPSTNATFYTFKSSGKYYTHKRGVMPNIFGHAERPNSDAVWTNEERREAILRANQNHMPGLSTTGSNLRVVVIIDADVDFGYPLCLEPMDD